MDWALREEAPLRDAAADPQPPAAAVKDTEDTGAVSPISTSLAQDVLPLLSQSSLPTVLWTQSRRGSPSPAPPSFSTGGHPAMLMLLPAEVITTRSAAVDRVWVFPQIRALKPWFPLRWPKEERLLRGD